MNVLMEFSLPIIVLRVLSTLTENNFQSFIVGGAVRDLLQEKTVSDWDFTTDATPQDLLQLFHESYYDNTFGTVRVAGKHLALQFNLPSADWEDIIFDLTTFRTDHGYSDRRRPDRVQWGRSVEEDLSRRDFTINAMAIRVSASAIQALSRRVPATAKKSVSCDIIDPFGGHVDLSKSIVRAVGDPHLRFNEDALRMMRAIRIGAQLGFSIEPETLTAIKGHAYLISHVSWERIHDEFLKIIASPYPADGVLLMYTCGLLALILPELLEAKNVPQGGHHTLDVWTHSIESLRHCPSSDPIVRLATLLHDIGKPRAFREIDGAITFYNHEVVGTRMAQRIAERLRLSNPHTEKLVTLVRWHMFAYEPSMSDAAIRRFIRRVGVENINDMMLLRVGDRKGGGSKATSWRLRELQERIGKQLYEPMSIKDLKVDGHDVMEVLAIPPGPKVGKILNALFEEVMEDTSNNTREYLLERITRLGSGR